MQIISTIKNTIYISDIDLTIPCSDKSVFISSDNLKKSKMLQSMIIDGYFKILEYNSNERIESNLAELCKKNGIDISGIELIKNNNHQTVNYSIKSNPDNDFVIQIQGHMLEAGGYAKVNRNLIFGLSNVGFNIVAKPLKSLNNNLKKDELEKLSFFINKNYSVPLISIDSMIPTFGKESNSRYKILYTTIESYSIPQQFIDTANIYNEIWVVSDFCKNILSKYGIKKPIYVMPNSIDINHYTMQGEKYSFDNKMKNFIFVSVFGWGYRKGYDVLLKAFCEEFTADDNVSLLLITRNPMGRENVIKETIQKYLSFYKNPPIIIRTSSVIPENDMPKIYRACNAFVLFSRGEAWGLPYTEASLCGLPVIGTNCSGQTMFLNHDNSYLVDVDDYEAIPTGTMDIHYWDNQIFPRLKSDKVISEAGKNMRFVYENYSKAQKKNELLRKNIITNYSIDHVINKMKERLLQIKEKLC